MTQEKEKEPQQTSQQLPFLLQVYSYFSDLTKVCAEIAVFIGKLYLKQHDLTLEDVKAFLQHKEEFSLNLKDKKLQ